MDCANAFCAFPSNLLSPFSRCIIIVIIVIILWTPTDLSLSSQKFTCSPCWFDTKYLYLAVKSHLPLAVSTSPAVEELWSELWIDFNATHNRFYTIEGSVKPKTLLAKDVVANIEQYIYLNIKKGSVLILNTSLCDIYTIFIHIDLKLSKLTFQRIFTILYLG